MTGSETGSGGPFAFLSRRRFLKLALGLAAVPVAGVGGVVALRGSAPSIAGLRMLSDHEFATLTALVTTQLPAGGPWPEGADGEAIARAFDGFIADEPDHIATDLKRALTLVELGPVIFDRKLVTFSNLSEADRLTHWQAWITSDTLLRRQVAIAFRKFISLVYFDQPTVWPHIGYPGPFLVRGYGVQGG